MIRRISIYAAATLAATVVLWRTAAADTPLPEYQVKAAIVYKVAKFVDWPPTAFVSSSAPLVLCIAGNDPFGQYIDNLNGEIIQGRPLIVRRAEIDQRALLHCHIVFVGDETGKQLVFESIAGNPVLTIGDSIGFAESGGMLGLSIDNNRVAFEVNLSAARDAGLDISASLLQLAKIVTSQAIQ
ncbi:MAG: YfiR family protein [Gammaproteobacteria bacterium]|nr:YfiR family protein [Gammaproteobacteria bacterium]